MSAALMAALAAAAALFPACSGSPPEILEVRRRLVLFDDRERNAVYEYLGVAVRADDRDGADDLESLALIHDGKELYWLLTEDRWSKRQIRQETWLAADGIVSAGAGALPRGIYRVVVKDYAGQKAETSFRLETSAESGAEFPSLRRGEASLDLVSRTDEAVLMVSSASGALLGSFTLKKGPNARDAILANAQVRSQAKNLYLYQPGGPEGRSLVSGPYEASDFLFPREP